MADITLDYNRMPIPNFSRKMLQIIFLFLGFLDSIYFVSSSSSHCFCYLDLIWLISVSTGGSWPLDQLDLILKVTQFDVNFINLPINNYFTLQHSRKSLAVFWEVFVIISGRIWIHCTLCTKVQNVNRVTLCICWNRRIKEWLATPYSVRYNFGPCIVL